LSFGKTKWAMVKKNSFTPKFKTQESFLKLRYLCRQF